MMLYSGYGVRRRHAQNGDVVIKIHAKLGFALQHDVADLNVNR
jgi:hypothetical protein